MSAPFCHPTNAHSTKCCCGRTLRLPDMDEHVCRCGLSHKRAPGGWRGRLAGGKRKGGREGCPGMDSLTVSDAKEITTQDRYR
jgi:hypothetical protein